MCAQLPGGTSWPRRAAGWRCTQTEITSLYIDYELSYISAHRLFLTDKRLGTSALLLAARAPWAAARCPYQLLVYGHPGKQREWGKKAPFPSLSLQNTHRAAPVSPTHSRHGVQVVGGSPCPCSRAHVPSPCLPGEQGGGKRMGLQIIHFLYVYLCLQDSEFCFHMIIISLLGSWRGDECHLQGYKRVVYIQLWPIRV